MANKRMIAKTIVDSDVFLDMPHSTQNLYFHLNLRADDDGFISNPRKIMRMIGSQDDDLKILLSKRYLLMFESGVIVIKHWKIHNTIQKDRYQPTLYKEELELLEEKDNKAYTERKHIGNKLYTDCKQNVDKMYPECIQNGNETETQIRLDKSSKDKINTEPDPEIITLPTLTPTAEPNGSEGKGLSKLKDPLANYYQDLITKIQPDSTWGDYGKERQQLNTLAKKTERLFSDGVPYNDEHETAQAIITKFLEMKKAKHWKADKPFIPSSISNLWPEIIDNLIKDNAVEQEYANIRDDDWDIPF